MVSSTRFLAWRLRMGKKRLHLLTELVMFTHCSPNKRCCHLFGSTDIAEILALWLSNPALQQATFVDKLPLLTLWTIHKTWAKSVHSPFPGWATRESFPTWAGVDKVQCRREPGVRSSILGHSWILGFLISIFFSGTSGTFTMWLVFRTSIDIFSKM